MKILLVSGSPLQKVGNDYYAEDPWIRFPINLAKKCETFTIWVPVLELPEGTQPSRDSWKLELGDLKVEANKYFNTFVKFYKLLPRNFIFWQQRAASLVREHDAVLIRYPSPLLPIVARAALAQGKPFIPLLAGDIASQSDRILGSSGLKKLFYKMLVKVWVHKEKRWCRRASLIYAYNQELAHRHRGSKAEIRPFRTPHLNLSDFVHRKDSFGNRPVRILRVCWLLPSKGLETLFHSLSLLVKQGLDLQLELVGKERTPGYQAHLEDLAAQLGLRDKIQFTGWIPFDRIQEAFLRNDMQVISSHAEGTPRVILEGAARGLPLVCTTSGGCADNLTHEKDALLIPPGNAELMAEAIGRVITDEGLRSRLIENGYKTARKFTFESLGDSVLADLKRISRTHL